MSPDIVNWIWFLGGVLLIAAETQWPHFYAGFLGLGAILVAALRWIGLIENPIVCLVVWGIFSMTLLLTLRRFAVKLLYSESSVSNTDEDMEAIGEVVEVVTAISKGSDPGRIRFRGTTWPATSTGDTIPAGKKAKILYRENLVWIVEAWSELNHSEDRQKPTPPLLRSGGSSG